LDQETGMRIKVVMTLLGAVLLPVTVRAESVHAWVKASEAAGVVRVTVLDQEVQTCERTSRVAVPDTTDGEIVIRPGDTVYFERNSRVVPLVWREGERVRSTAPPPKGHALLGYICAVRTIDGSTVTWRVVNLRIGNHPDEILVKRTQNFAGETRYVA